MTIPTDEFIDRVRRDMRDALTKMKCVSPYRLSIEYPYGGHSREMLYAAIKFLEKSGEITVVSTTQRGGHTGRRYAFTDSLPAMPAKPKPTGNKVKPYQPNVFSGVLNRRGLDDPVGRMEFLQGMR